MEWTGRQSNDKIDDEYYTPYDVIKEQLDPIIDEIRDKKIICPCDSEWSNFYKYLKDNGCKNITLAQDFYKVNYNDYDVCITNPPFSIIDDFIGLLISSNIKFIIIGPGQIPQYQGFINMNNSSYNFVEGTKLIAIKNWTNSNKCIGVRWYSNVKSWLREREREDVEIGKRYSVGVLNSKFQDDLTYLVYKRDGIKNKTQGGIDVYFYKKQQKLG